MKLGFTALSLLILAAWSASASAGEPLTCNVNALSASQRDRHHALSEKLRKAVVERRELANGYELALDLARLPADYRGIPFCVVEVAEWVDLEARCCPFLDFGIDLRGKGGLVKVRLTGGENVKAFLKTERALAQASNEQSKAGTGREAPCDHGSGPKNGSRRGIRRVNAVSARGGAAPRTRPGSPPRPRRPSR